MMHIVTYSCSDIMLKTFCSGIELHIKVNPGTPLSTFVSTVYCDVKCRKRMLSMNEKVIHDLAAKGGMYGGLQKHWLSLNDTNKKNIMKSLYGLTIIAQRSQNEHKN